MRAACHLPNRSVDAPFNALRSVTARQRVGRCICILAVLCGQIGLPDVAQWVSAAVEPKPTATASADAGCQCPPALRRVGRCCCAARSQAAPTSCCAKQKSCRKEAGERKKTGLTYRDACPCDKSADVDGYRCDEPRVMPPGFKVAQFVERTPTRPTVDSQACGELLPPPVPPPEFSLG